MKMTSRVPRATALTSAVLLTLGTAGCGSGDGAATDSSDGGGGTLAFASVSAQIPVITELGEQVSEAMKGEDIKVITQDANFDPAEQAKQLTTSINNGQIQAAWIFPVAAEALKPTLEAAQAKKIPVVVEADPAALGFDGPQPGIVFNAASFSDYGKKIADEAAACVKTAGVSEVLYLEAPGVAAGAQEVHDSILAEFEAEAPDAEIVGTAQAQDPATAQTKVAQLLIAHPDATAVIAASDETTIGALGAFAAAGKELDCIVAGGGGPDTQKALDDGKLTAIVAWDYAASVDAAAKDLVRLLDDPTADGIVNPTPISVLK